ncbi:anaerobic ribonucleoside triphosphate reductase [bacterium BMS3Bbin07]|nr:anaerobic ribonucleoside triphosphate reductase [bacterium BMS3Bbin07]
MDFTDDMFEALDHQDTVQQRYTGGTVLHLFIGEKIEDTGALKRLIKTICEQYHLPYFTVTPTFSVCPVDGYIAGEFAECPRCHEETEIYSRIVGYLRPVRQWNKGKKEEFRTRKEFVQA